ncbi:MAG: AmmeMemoRadiSam system radical SAM enzyme [Candidatus Altiarchaeum hamiconexum]|uniref:AmmeMemoRadiSam system radical SAM enzyme n=1 Tax=Candidatus Altarchaeum hamiconexum TaxID=1803513 RepID=A0A8J7YVN8_9ARCH|nr:AmmeMemoRadiSam system radical SAM enzyme [Candidatus Altarchaeum hamiconexum]OIQ06100.1 MAG: AmmeMemoRadiSam system radical SAM enzyme [Candidatus Altarchaeum sp. CG2_30_32_3053]PIV28811.1 MAG: AmmeMemoRadiSam system radical SAM enzyme [Candidatus Altarchaeum sp. CG03_land_8_20_14_0_80_32_618]PIZ32180.1 MAG: AmmeMemoRadiSam system radical SAM enzyme [Candidatus Altarchaeum sp. CG_4_10_14_0_8_um_filter_32_851]PJC16137.1 MAG: AmmeMemoRadiSam system radical SAM enzyme [Candidatus Altarchaeum s
MKEAMLYEKLEKGKNLVRCNLCNHHCVIVEGKRGICGVRENRKGTLYSLNYGKIIASNIDPIEKKPFFHFLPGSKAFSISGEGCNFSCRHCQNWKIAHLVKRRREIYGENFRPEDIVEMAKKYNCKSISCTYTEPTIFFEFAYDTAKIAKKQGIYNNFVSNGYMSGQTINLMSGLIDAINVDIKAWTEKIYWENFGASLEKLLKTTKLLKKTGIWIEITTLLIPSLNDSEEQIKGVIDFVQDEIGKETPLHFSLFYPHYKLMHIPSTPIETARKAREMALESGLRYVYTGNYPGDEGENTYCYNCKNLLIKRCGFMVEKNLIEKGRCPHCGVKINGVFE